ncbi:MAG: beta-ketoacyl synthase N-terminal-like domain-containing protein, partial [Desulfobacteraceae bacterium]|nr:beta-ketoacyl synthase N-terminal-like domain-containing protein [Desulfobacteraceae bacterium]
MVTPKTPFTLAACVSADERRIQRFLQGRNLPFTVIVDFGYVTESIRISHQLKRMAEDDAARRNGCIRIMPDSLAVLDRLAAEICSAKVATMILAWPKQPSKKVMAAARKMADRLFVEIYSHEMAQQMEKFNPDGFVLRGKEAGGICADTNNSTLLSSIRPKTDQLIWVMGGVGPQSIPAYAKGGADGAIFSDALLLMPELAADLKEHDLQALKAGVRTQAIDIGGGLHIRLSQAYPGLIERIRTLCNDQDRQVPENENQVESRLRQVLSLVEEYQTMARCFMGEEAAWAQELSQKFSCIQEMIGALQKELLPQEVKEIVFHPDPKENSAADIRATDVAIIGMSAIVPGAENLDRFWHNILAKVYTIRDVPAERWSATVNFHPDPDHKDTAYSTKGGFLDEIPINSMEWGIPPGSMKNVEPAQLLALEAVKQALADAGYDRREFDREKTSVIFGFAGGGDLLLAYSIRAALREYMDRAKDIPDPIRQDVLASVNEVLPEWTEDAFPGILGNVIAGRVANRFNFNGLNFTMDAACASSMAALQVACQELAYGITKTAIVGGVDASQHPFGFTCFSKTKALSVAGQSRPFSSDADGIVLGEGVGVVVLKRLADALADNDRVYAVIKGIGGASDGKGSGMTVPVSRGQKMAIYRAYEVAGFKTDSVDLMEAHGTGTPLGDRVELETLHEVLQQHGATQPCAIGSIKSAIGHTKGAAGIIGVIKTALALHHKILPAHVNVDKVHAAVSHPKTRVYVNMETKPWFRKLPERPRRAGASAFGFGGTNFHTILEEFDGQCRGLADLPSSLWPSELFFFGAMDVPALIKRIEAALALLNRSEHSLTRLAYEHYRYQNLASSSPLRVAIRVNSVQQLKEKLVKGKSLLAEGALSAHGGSAQNTILLGEGIWGALNTAPPGPLTALFPGQGAQKLHMLKDLSLVFPLVREGLEQANAILAPEFFPLAQGVLTDYIFPAMINGEEARKAAMQALTQTTVAQPALAAVEMALYRLLAQFNVKIAMAAGHSFGELTALWAAGVMSDAQLLTLACKRGRSMAQSSEVPTGMVAVQIHRDALKPHIEAIPDLSIANYNTPKQVVVSGSIAALENFEALCKEQKWSSKRLPVSQAFHSPFMAAAEKQWSEALSEEHFDAPGIPVYANMTAKPYGKTAPSIAGTLGKHLRNGVDFVGEIEEMHAAGARTFIEIGPGATLTNFVDTILAGQPHLAIAVQPKEGKPGVEMLLDSLAALYVRGYDIDLKPAFSGRILSHEKQKPAPSATTFLVNGGRAKPTIKLRVKKETAPKVPRWTPPPASVPAASMAAARPAASAPTSTPVMPKTAKSPQPAISSPPPIPKTPPTVHAAAAPPRTSAVSRLDEEEKLKKMKYFQKSMNLFLETQERFHQQRLAMMEKMWNINQQLLQGLLGGAPQAGLNMGADQTIPTDIISQGQSSPPVGRSEAASLFSTVPTPADSYPSSPPPESKPVVVEVVVPPRPVEPSPKIEAVDYKALLFDIISERTQYPVEMLSPEQQIEGDLGIDSIKRVEIISMMQNAHPTLAGI